MVLLLHLFNLVGAPVELAVSRAMEHEADRFGLEVTRANRSAAMSFVLLTVRVGPMTMAPPITAPASASYSVKGMMAPRPEGSVG